MTEIYNKRAREIRIRVKISFNIVTRNLLTRFDLLQCYIFGRLRWLDWIFLGGYRPRLSINYVGMSKDMGKRLPQLYYIMMKISYDLGFIAIGVAMAT